MCERTVICSPLLSLAEASPCPGPPLGAVWTLPACAPVRVQLFLLRLVVLCSLCVLYKRAQSARLSLFFLLHKYTRKKKTLGFLDTSWDCRSPLPQIPYLLPLRLHHTHTHHVNRQSGCLMNVNAPQRHPNICLPFLTSGRSYFVLFQCNFCACVAFKSPFKSSCHLHFYSSSPS